MNDTTWIPFPAATRRGPALRRIMHSWTTRVVMPLHRALDSALQAGELRGLGAGTLADIGYRKD